MASIILMPKQGLLMEEGTIVNWLVKEGEKATEGEPLFEMETDKLTITMDSTATGTMLKILEPEGSVVPITKPIAIIGEPGEDISGLVGGGTEEAAAPAEEAPAAAAEEAPAEAPAKPVRAPGERVFASPRAKLRAEENGIDIAEVAGSGEDGMIVEKDVMDYLKNRPAATPLAKNVAAQQGIDIAGVEGSGVGGKVTVADVAPAAAPAPAAAEAPAAAAAPAGNASRGVRRERMSGMRRAIMNNMLNSKQINAQTNTRMCIDMTEAVALREKYKALGIKISYNDIIVRACAKALQEFPVINASVDGNEIVYHDYVNVGIAVAVPNGLIVPVIKDADIIGITGINEQSAELIAKARDGKLTDADYHGGTFTVSSLGMFDVDDFVAIINPPESAILAVGKIAKTPVVDTDAEGNDVVVIKQICNVSLSYDHRIIDGAVSAQFMKRLKELLQNPVLMI